MPEAPQGGALRAVFAGIGRILNITDKVRNKPDDAGAHVNGTTTETTAPGTPVPEAAAPEPTAPETVVSETAAEPARPETTTPEMAAETTPPETTTTPETAAEPALSEMATPETAAPEPETTTPEPAAELPLPNYGELTIASVRARLRNLSVAQLGELIEYEKTHADRADFIAMFERRIAKVESGK